MRPIHKARHVCRRSREVITPPQCLITHYYQPRLLQPVPPLWHATLFRHFAAAITLAQHYARLLRLLALTPRSRQKPHTSHTTHHDEPLVKYLHNKHLRWSSIHIAAHRLATARARLVAAHFTDEIGQHTHTMS
jgi:hypothetical protein